MSEVVATSQQGLADKYHPYPEYKDSGVEWLGNVPSHWTVTAVKRFTSFTTGWTPPTGNDAYFGGEHLWANISDIGPRVLSTTAKTITDEGVRATRIKKSPKGSLLFSFKLSIGFVSIVGEDMYTNEAIATFFPSETFNIAYMYCAAPIFIPKNAEENIYGAKLLNQERISNASFVLPTPAEQKTIAAFLDYETARIDRLIAQQQRLIELLKEKRQALISHAVTKGLNPNAPMQDSGIDWLGQVPVHWMVKPLRHLGYCQNGINIGAEAFGSGYPFVSYGDAYKNRVLPETGSGLVQSTPEDRKRYSLLAGDVLFTRTSETIEEIGFASACLKTIKNVSFAGFLIRFRPNSNDLDVNYSKYYFSNQLLRAFFIKEMNLITRASLSQDLLKTMPVVLPPRTEQKAIAEVLDEKSKRFNRLQQLGEEQIKILQERRTTLISAAVTGKIDLRGWTPPSDNEVTA